MSSATPNDPFSRLTAHADSPSDGPTDPPMQVDYRGTQGPLFRLGLKTALLTLVTLGLYRFWAKTRVRKYFWSATAPGGDPMEYTGNGLEKLLGFLIAVAFLAVYLGLFQLLLMFAGLSLLSGSGSGQDTALQIAASQATLVAVFPFIFYAQYRARRYILSRTRWRGVRFGVEPAAWGYVWRATGHWILTILSLGLLLPRQTFLLEKYKIDRTWYGNARFEQHGRWQSLYPAMKHYFIAAAAMAIPALLAASSGQPVWLVLTFFGALWFYYAVVYYSVASFRIMAETKRLGNTVQFTSTPRGAKVFWTYVLGGLLSSTCAGMVFSAFFIIAGNFLGSSDLFAVEDLTEFDGLADFGLAEAIGIFMVFVGYIMMLVLYGVFALIFVRQPVLEHYVQETQILNPAALDDIQQRSRDEMVEAEGFADALDVGAAI
ncbi:DUF898 family protein [Neptunicoccus cionae]|uniref:DUF898 family protein n=1 Tax=Neptunicoccus cionae TaxID=2035344 RepID=UPI000C75616F|nr:DUF898 family protein [Amylibacter cionae]PLS19991.1 DUF898 domain-containing protein [Amylibacter cionae]